MILQSKILIIEKKLLFNKKNGKKKKHDLRKKTKQGERYSVDDYVHSSFLVENMSCEFLKTVQL